MKKVGLRDIVALLRIKQWYKNIIIFIPLIFSLNLFNLNSIFLIILGFFCLCFVSSSSYIVNDIKDKEKDKHSEEKKKRPISSGKIGIKYAVIISACLFIIGIISAYLISSSFFYLIILLFLISQFYTFIFRNIAYLDVIVISINFIIRAVSGIYIINVPISYWIILCTFFLSIFLVSGKRISEMTEREISLYRPSLKNANKTLLLFMMILSIIIVFILFSLYSILYNPLMLVNLPISFYISLAYINSVYKHPSMARNPEKFIFSNRIIILLILWAVMLVISLYFKL